MGKRWSNGVTGSAVALTISGAGVVNATAGSSTAPSTTTNAAASAPGGTSITLRESFSVGNVAGYLVTLSCNGTSVPVTIDAGTNSATATFTTPATGAVTCAYTNSLTPYSFCPIPAGSATSNAIYSVGAGGNIRRLEIGAASDAVVAQLALPATITTDLNALMIDRSRDRMLVHTPGTLWAYDAANGGWYAATTTGVNANYPRGGIDANGVGYLIEGTSSPGVVRIQANATGLGYTATPYGNLTYDIAPTNYSSGDISFDANGIGWLVAGADIYRIDFSSPNPIAERQARPLINGQPVGWSWAGMAFAENGQMYLGRNDQVAAYYAYNPGAGTLTQVASGAVGQARDMASCAFPTQAEPDLSVVKTLAQVNGVAYAGGPVAAGDTLTYAITISNTGTAVGTVYPDGVIESVPANTAYVATGNTFSQASGANWTVGSVVNVPAGGSAVLNFVVRVVDPLPRGVANVANNVTFPPGGLIDCSEIGNVCSVTTPVVILSQTLTKALTSNADGDNSGAVSQGDMLTYTVTVTNTSTSGNLTNVVVSDSKITPSTITCASVAPGATCVLTGTYAVTAADVTAGSISNTATATSPVCPVGSTAPECTMTIDTPTARRAIDAVDDTYTAINGVAGNPNVGNAYIENDTLNNQPVNPVDITGTVTTPAIPINGGPVPALDPVTGVVSVPAGTPAGTYTITYQICEKVDPTNCDTATITVTVDAAVIDAVDDTSPPVNGSTGGTTPSVLVNDALNGHPVNTSDVTLTPGTSPNPGLTMNPDGTITVAPGTPAGTYTYPYQICEVLNPTNCDSANAVVVVGAAPIVANDDTYTGINGATGSTNVGNGYTGNDTLNDQPIMDVSTIVGTVTAPATPINGGSVPTLDPVTGVVSVPAGTPAGTYTIIYQICEKLNPTNCDTATTTVMVDAAPIDAVDDNVGTVDGANGIPNAGNAYANDMLNGQPVNPAGITGTVTAPATPINGGPVPTLDPVTGVVSVPADTPAGTYTIAYQLCEKLNPSNCDTATITVTVVSKVDIRLTKTAGVREVRIGDLVRYTLSVENVGTTDFVNGSIVDTPAAGFSYVEGSLVSGDADGMATVSGSSPLRFAGIDVPAGRTVTLVYVMRVGAGVRPGTHVNRAQAHPANGESVSNVATAEVMLTADPTLDDSLIFGTVFNDRDGDGWQDNAELSGIKVQGGFEPGAYIANSTTVDRGTGPQPEADASSPMLHGITVGQISARQSVADPIESQVVIRQRLNDLAFTDDFVLTSAQGVTVRMDKDGKTTVEKTGDAAKGLNAAVPTVERRVAQGEGGYVVDYVITNTGIDERGIPGVRIASVEGLLIETDQFGRYHLAGMNGGAWERGRNFILKVDPSTLPAGAEFTTDNPLLRRITPGVPVRFDWGVKLPEQVIEGGSEQIELEMGEVFFAPGSAEVREKYRPVIETMAAKVRQYQGGEVVIQANADSEGLAFERANAVKSALLEKLDPAAAKGLVVSARGDVDDPGSLIAGVDEGGALLGTVLFDTDKSAIRPEFEPLLDKVAAALERMGGGSIAIIGHTDVRAPHAYNVALGMRRAKAVYEALAKRLSPEMRAKVKVEASNNPTAPAGARK